jgi:tight adherence protein B
MCRAGALDAPHRTRDEFAMLANPIVMLGATSDLVMYILPIAGSMLLCFGIYQVWNDSRTSEKRKLQDRLRGDRVKSDRAMETILRRGALQDAATFADKVLGKFHMVPKLQRVLDQADIPWSASQTLVNLASLAIMVTAGLFVLKVHIIAALGCGVGVVLLPIMAFGFVRRRRMAKLSNQLPDVFEMMSQALRAGHSLPGSIQLVHEQMPAPIATEFGQVYHEQNLGLKIEEALQSMAQRVDSLDVQFFVTAVVIQRQTGGDLAEVLDNISGVIRERIELQGLVRGLTAEGRLSGWVLFALPFIVLGASLYMNPQYAGVLFEDPRGKIMMMVAAGMQLMGLAMIRWIVNIKV